MLTYNGWHMTLLYNGALQGLTQQELINSWNFDPILLVPRTHINLLKVLELCLHSAALSIIMCTITINLLLQSEMIALCINTYSLTLICNPYLL